MAAFSLQGPLLPFACLFGHGCCPLADPQRLGVYCSCVCVYVCMLALLLHNHRTGQQNPEGYHPRTESPHFGLWKPAFTSVSAIGLAEIQSRQRVSPLRLFLVVCPHGLLCLDTLTTRSREVATFQLAVSLSESKLF